MISPTDSSIRAFIAIELPSDLTDGLKRLQSEMKRSNPTSIKWVDPGSIHLTLKFLGNIALSKVPQVTGVLEKACSPFSPLILKTGSLGAFPNLRRPRVFWLGIGGDLNIVMALQKSIDDLLVSIGFAAEARPFSPHLTLARVKEGAMPQERGSFGELIAHTSWKETYDVHVSGVNLMRSQLFPTGPIYSSLAQVKLVTSENK
jgi:2'-5' RNA ligase